MIEYLPKPRGENVGVGIGLELKDGMVLSTCCRAVHSAAPKVAQVLQ